MNRFKEDIAEGLASKPKTLPSKYFYNAKGDKLFVEIMNLPEYYLTRAELEVFQSQHHEIVQSFGFDGSFDLIELGAGDGSKTIELLSELQKQKRDFCYKPIDISNHALNLLAVNVNAALSGVHIEAYHGDYFKLLASMQKEQQSKVILFLGSNLGNMTDSDASSFLHALSNVMKPGDKLLLGLDLKKGKDVVLPAYNDAKGVTRAFNLNLLERINEELEADFNIDCFDHSPHYDEKVGIAESFIESLEDQKVHIASIGKTFEFKKGEKIKTEISRKYDDEILSDLLRGSRLELVKKFSDSKALFTDYLLKKV